jgi:hypothetical protein
MELVSYLVKFHGKELTARPTSKLEDESPLLAVCNHSQYLDADSSSRNLRTRHAMFIRDNLGMTWRT